MSETEGSSSKSKASENRMEESEATIIELVDKVKANKKDEGEKSLVAPLSDLPNRVLEETFMIGLIPWIKSEVEFLEPTRLAQTMRLSQRVENKDYMKGREQMELKNVRCTMKVRGKIHGEEVIVLIDCKATHNFISEKVVVALKLHTKETSNYGVILGSGTTIKSKGVCKNVEVMLNEWRVVQSFLPLELGELM
ncbi:ty3-gypsy retroelement transposase [Cucumis melo var. makuwa]|uniref:Ty3-gypsy retroelement transposase n=1 Tax=Cucumis melo var. makuwa TaxID=1194695 RepID=A0A5D3BL33_CUCMM|nr:ty3-gypsy retroelement transposase [Cucumis melo var. makuwa]